MVLNEQTNPPAVTDLIPIEQNIPLNPEIRGALRGTFIEICNAGSTEN